MNIKNGMRSVFNVEILRMLFSYIALIGGYIGFHKSIVESVYTSDLEMVPFAFSMHILIILCAVLAAAFLLRNTIPLFVKNINDFNIFFLLLLLFLPIPWMYISIISIVYMYYNLVVNRKEIDTFRKLLYILPLALLVFGSLGKFIIVFLITIETQFKKVVRTGV